jgi:hypothetical protein
LPCEEFLHIYILYTSLSLSHTRARTHTHTHTHTHTEPRLDTLAFIRLSIRTLTTIVFSSTQISVTFAAVLFLIFIPVAMARTLHCLFRRVAIPYSVK